VATRSGPTVNPHGARRSSAEATGKASAAARFRTAPAPDDGTLALSSRTTRARGRPQAERARVVRLAMLMRERDRQRNVYHSYARSGRWDRSLGAEMRSRLCAQSEAQLMPRTGATRPRPSSETRNETSRGTPAAGCRSAWTVRSRRKVHIAARANEGAGRRSESPNQPAYKPGKCDQSRTRRYQNHSALHRATTTAVASLDRAQYRGERDSTASASCRSVQCSARIFFCLPIAG
jgi:hypothetical protein